jgi:hypothetical protein
MGSCPIGSTWSAGDIPDLRLKEGENPGFLDLNNLKRKPLMDRPDWMPDWGVDAGIMAAGILGGGRNPGSKQAVWQSMKNMGTRLKDSKLMDRLFKTNKKQYNKDGSPKIVPGQPVYKNVRPNWNTTLKQWEFRGKKINPQTWNNGKGVNSTQRVRVGTNPKLDAKGNPIPVTARDWSKLKIGTGLALPGAAGIQALMNQFGGDAPVSKVDTDPSSPTYKGGREARAGRGPAPEPNAMQRLGANMKDPKWWHESISGLPSDTRLMRLGQLMEYYGKTPKQRADSTAPAELWAENEVAHGKNVAAASSGSDSTFLAKFNSEDQDLAIRKSVRDRLGFSDWIPLNQASEEELEQTVARVKGLIQEYVKKGMNWSDALTLSMSYVTKE